MGQVARWRANIMRFLTTIFVLAVLALSGQAAGALQIYVIDVEGGNAKIIVSPSGQSMLLDAGWPGFNGRDVDRIVEAVKAAGLRQIDHLVITLSLVTIPSALKTLTFESQAGSLTAIQTAGAARRLSSPALRSVPPLPIPFATIPNNQVTPIRILQNRARYMVSSRACPF